MKPTTQEAKTPNNISSSVLKRLIEEVKVEELECTGSRYDRVHNRHNR